MKRYFGIAALVLSALSTSAYAYKVDWQKFEDGRPKYSGKCDNGGYFAGQRDGVYESMPWETSGPKGSKAGATMDESIRKACGE